MAILSRKEFASLMGMSDTKIINTNVGRKKIIIGLDKDNYPLDDRKKLDTDHPTNKAFFDARVKLNNKRKLKSATLSYESVVEVSKPKTRKKVAHPNVKNKSEENIEFLKNQKKEDLERQKLQNKLQALELRKKVADTELQERKAEAEKVKLDKLAGKLIPVELVDNILGIYTRSIFTKFQSSLERLASTYTDILAAGDRNKLSEISGKLAEHLDEIIKGSEEVANKSIEQSIDDYSEVRSRGEKK